MHFILIISNLIEDTYWMFFLFSASTFCSPFSMLCETVSVISTRPPYSSSSPTSTTHSTGNTKRISDASTKRPLPVLVLLFKTSLNDFIPDNHEFQVKITLVYIIPKFRFPEKFPVCIKHS